MFELIFGTSKDEIIKYIKEAFERNFHKKICAEKRADGYLSIEEYKNKGYSSILSDLNRRYTAYQQSITEKEISDLINSLTNDYYANYVNSYVLNFDTQQDSENVEIIDSDIQKAYQGFVNYVNTEEYIKKNEEKNITQDNKWYVNDHIQTTEKNRYIKFSEKTNTEISLTDEETKKIKDIVEKEIDNQYQEKDITNVDYKEVWGVIQDSTKKEIAAFLSSVKLLLGYAAAEAATKEIVENIHKEEKFDTEKLKKACDEWIAKEKLQNPDIKKNEAGYKAIQDEKIKKIAEETGRNNAALLWAKEYVESAFDGNRSEDKVTNNNPSAPVTTQQPNSQGQSIDLKEPLELRNTPGFTNYTVSGRKNIKGAVSSLYLKRYYSNVDCEIYINGEWFEDVQSIDWDIQSNKMPLYGFNSFIFDEVACANRIITGSFIINFTNPRTLEDYINTQGKTEAQNPLTYEQYKERTKSLSVEANINNINTRANIIHKALWNIPFELDIVCGEYDKLTPEIESNAVHIILCQCYIIDSRSMRNKDGDVASEMYQFIARDFKTIS